MDDLRRQSSRSRETPPETDSLRESLEVRVINKLPLSILVTTRNEEINISRCLTPLTEWADQVVVVDSDSSDATVRIARSLGAEIVSLPYEHGRIIPWIYQWCLDNVELRNSWVMILEADQLVTEPLRAEISSLLLGPDVREAGFYVRRVHIFRGTKLRFGGYGRKRMLKLFRRDRGQLDPVEQDTRVYVDGPVGSLKGTIEEWNRKEESILFYLEKHLRYADAFAHEELRRSREALAFKTRGRLFGSPDERILWQKTLWMRLPLGVRPFLYFFYRYFLLLGILDGKDGFVLYFLQSLWFRFVVDIRLAELRSSATADEGSNN